MTDYIISKKELDGLKLEIGTAESNINRICKSKQPVKIIAGGELKYDSYSTDFYFGKDAHDKDAGEGPRDKKLFYNSGSDEPVNFDGALEKVNTCNCNNEKLKVIENWTSGKETYDEYYICPKCNKTLWFRKVKNMVVILEDIYP